MRYRTCERRYARERRAAIFAAGATRRAASANASGETGNAAKASFGAPSLVAGIDAVDDARLASGATAATSAPHRTRERAFGKRHAVAASRMACAAAAGMDVAARRAASPASARLGRAATRALRGG